MTNVYILQVLSYDTTDVSYKSDRYGSGLPDNAKPSRVSRPLAFASFEDALEYLKSDEASAPDGGLGIPADELIWESVSDDNGEAFRATASSHEYGGYGSDWTVFYNVSLEPVREISKAWDIDEIVNSRRMPDSSEPPF